MIHTVKETYELYETSKLEEIKQAAVTADRMGLKDQADLIFALHLHIKQSLAKSASIFKGIRALIRQQELAAAAPDKQAEPDVISEMRFEKSFPAISLKPTQEP